jgi:hypothetical protein
MRCTAAGKESGKTEDPHAGAGVGSADADVVEASGEAQGDDAGLVDAVATNAIVGVGAVCWIGLGRAV